MKSCLFAAFLLVAGAAAADVDEGRRRLANAEAAVSQAEAALALAREEKDAAAEDLAREALASARQAADLERKTLISKLNSDAVSIVRRRPKEALEKLDKARELAPGNRDIEINRWIAASLLAFDDARFDEAEFALKKILSLDPDDQASARLLERVYLRRREQKAELIDPMIRRLGGDLLVQVPELRASPEAERVLKGFQALKDRDWQVVLGWWRQALDGDPRNTALKRSVDLAAMMVERGKTRASRNPSKFEGALDAFSKGDGGMALTRIAARARTDPALAAEGDRLTERVSDSIRRGESHSSPEWLDPNGVKQSLSDKLLEDGIMFDLSGLHEAADRCYRESDWWLMSDPAKQAPRQEPKPSSIHN